MQVVLSISDKKKNKDAAVNTGACWTRGFS